MKFGDVSFKNIKCVELVYDIYRPMGIKHVYVYNYFGGTGNRYIFDRSAYFTSTTVCSLFSASVSIGIVLVRKGFPWLKLG